MTIYDLTDEYRRLEELDVTIPEDAEALEALTEEIANGFEAKAENYCKLMRNIQADCDALREEKRKIDAKLKSRESLFDSLKESLQWAAEQVWTEGESHKCGIFSLRIQRTPPRVELTGPVPEEYNVTTVSPNKSKIMEALKNGEDLPFAELQRGLTLAIR